MLTYPEENYSDIGMSLPPLPSDTRQSLNGGINIMGHGGRPAQRGLLQIRFPALFLKKRNVVFNPLPNPPYGNTPAKGPQLTQVHQILQKETPYYGTIKGF